jgi:transcriptional regulator with GAF, ATPase, and Fis domain
LGSDTGNTGTVAADLLSEAWCQEPSVEEDGFALYHSLRAVSVTAACAGNPDAALAEPGSPPAPTVDDQTFQAALDLLIGLLGAERAFLFRAPEERGAPFEDCVASRNFDGEEILQPADKVPRERLAEAAATGRPVLAAPEGPALPGPLDPSPAGPDAPDPVRSATFPLAWKDRLHGVLHIENRFRPLRLNRHSLRLAEIHCRLLALWLELSRLEDENHALWLDVARLREEEDARTSSSPPPLARAAPRSSKSPRRSDLKGDYSLIIGSSREMLEVFQVLDRISSSNAPVLITGESGTGKELIAQATHQNSPRRDKVFVSENCGALTETLLESELFGYVRGAFTGASKDHKGLFELAIGGTLFLDEVGDMSPGMQKKLLRVLQEGVIRRVGGKEYIPVDVRIISATNKDLLEEVRAGSFREDLYYRLNVIHLRLPPLRERKEDIPILVEHFLEVLNREAGTAKAVDAATLECLSQYSWPGNIRELQNEVRRMFALSEETIRVGDVSETILAGEKRDFPLHELHRELSRLTLKDATERLEKEMIRAALVQSRGNKSLVAKMLQVPKTSLYNKINKYGLGG